MLVVVSGWPGAGKSTVADAVAGHLAATVVGYDWVMSGLRALPEIWAGVELPVDRQREVAWSLMGRVIEQQLRRGASVVADLVARQVVVDRWRALAATYGTQFAVVECICSDPAVHRSRIEGRDRAIPGWYELTWEQAERSRDNYIRLDEPKLVVDAVEPVDNNVHTTLVWVAASGMRPPPEPTVPASRLRVTVGDNASELDPVLSARLDRYNWAAMASITLPRELTVEVHDEHNTLLAGLSGWTWGTSAGFAMVWVDEAHRRRGIGATMLAAAEVEAANRGCKQVFLTSFTFQAPKFYERYGYTEFARQDGLPIAGHADIHFCKQLPTTD